MGEQATAVAVNSDESNECACGDRYLPKYSLFCLLSTTETAVPVTASPEIQTVDIRDEEDESFQEVPKQWPSKKTRQTDLESQIKALLLPARLLGQLEHLSQQH